MKINKRGEVITTSQVRQIFNIENNVTTMFKDALYQPENGYSAYCEYSFYFNDVLAIFKDRFERKFKNEHGKNLNILQIRNLQYDWCEFLVNKLDSKIFRDISIDKTEFIFSYKNNNTVIENSLLMSNKYRLIKTQHIIDHITDHLISDFEFEVRSRNYNVDTKSLLDNVISKFMPNDLTYNENYISCQVNMNFRLKTDTQKYIRNAIKQHKLDDIASVQRKKEAKERFEKQRAAAKKARMKKVIDVENAIILDVKSTGLDSDDEIIKINIISAKTGKSLLNELVKPASQISDEAFHIHKMTNEMLDNAKSFKDLHCTILDIIKDKNLLIYNSDFVLKILQQSASKQGFTDECYSQLKSKCIMDWYSKFYGDYNEYFESYEWQKLTVAMEHQDIDISDLENKHGFYNSELTRRLIDSVNKSLSE
jgi:DNA polymerase III subunit epsilon